MKDFTEERVNKPIFKLIEQTEEEIIKISEKIKESRASIRVRCQYCEKLAKVGDLVYIQTQYYVPPEGCSGGAYWTDGEGQFECKWCHRVNRLIFDRKEISKLKYHFKTISEGYQ